MTKETLIPVRHEEVAVCGEYVLAAVTKDGKAYFSPRHVCDALGIAWQGQHVKIKDDEVLSSVVKIIVTTARDGKNYKTFMLPIEFANGWLFTIKKVRPELQAKLNLFRAEAFLALDAWFRQGLRKDTEVQTKFKIPQSLAEALEFAAEQVRKSERLAAENKVLAPKAEYHSGATKDGEEYYLREVARSFDTTHIQLSRFLLSKGIFRSVCFVDRHKPRGIKTRNVPRDRYVYAGYFTWTPDTNGHAQHVNYTITQKGVHFIAELLHAEGLIEAIPAWAMLHEEAA